MTSADLAGPFCTCGDYSCPAMKDSAANCGHIDTGAAVLDLPGSVCPCGDDLCGGTDDRTDCDNPHI
jgi:hypothetical protein